MSLGAIISGLLDEPAARAHHNHTRKRQCIIVEKRDDDEDDEDDDDEGKRPFTVEWRLKAKRVYREGRDLVHLIISAGFPSSAS